MTPEQCSATVAAIHEVTHRHYVPRASIYARPVNGSRFIPIEQEIDCGVVRLSLADDRHGNVVVRTLTTVPSRAAAEAVVHAMEREIETRGRATSTRWSIERQLDAE